MDLQQPDQFRAQSGDVRLDILMEMACASGYATAREQELLAPTLVVCGDGSELGIFELISNEAPIADMARVLIWATDATRAAICFEGWAYEVPETPEGLEALRRGTLPRNHIRPQDHPDRYDVLYVLGQAKGQEEVLRSWRIATDPQTKLRTFRPHEWMNESELGPSNFNPLFVESDKVRALIRKHAELARLRDRARTRRN